MRMSARARQSGGNRAVRAARVIVGVGRHAAHAHHLCARSGIGRSAATDNALASGAGRQQLRDDDTRTRMRCQRFME